MADEHTPIEELLGAYALDAVDDDERRQVEAYLEQNPRARAEVQAHREVAALLAFTGEPAPGGVWDRIAGALDDQAPPPGPALAATLSSGRRRWPAVVAAAAAATVAAAAAVVAVVVVRDDSEPGTASESAVEQAYGDAWSDPDARHARLVSDDGSLTADAVLASTGVGFLSGRALPELPASETYQLWGVYGDGDVISLGVIGNRPEIVPFSAEGDIDAVVITREQAGGVVSSTSGALLVGELA